MREIDVAWVAGIIEGEGSFVRKTAKHPGRHYHSAMVAVTMCDEDVIRRLHALTAVGTVGGPYTDRARNQKKPFWTWQVQNHEDAFALMRRVRPWMGARRSAKIDELLSADYGTENVALPSAQLVLVENPCAHGWLGCDAYTGGHLCRRADGHTGRHQCDCGSTTNGRRR